MHALIPMSKEAIASLQIIAEPHAQSIAGTSAYKKTDGLFFRTGHRSFFMFLYRCDRLSSDLHVKSSPIRRLICFYAAYGSLIEALNADVINICFYTAYGTSVLHKTLFIIPERRDRLLRHRDQREHVEDRHEANAYIAEIPHEGVGRHAADEEVDQRDDLIYIL